MIGQPQIMTYADIWRPETKMSARMYDVLTVWAGSLWIALLAQLAIVLPFTPVPITGQTFAVLLCGVLLGSRRGAASVLAYLGQGAMGLPFFAKGTFGLSVLTGATAGYLLAFIPAAFVVGWLVERRGVDRHLFPSVLAMTVGTLVIFAGGVAWLSVLFGFQKALAFGFFPFLPGAIVKLLAGALCLPLGWKLLGHQGMK